MDGDKVAPTGVFTGTRPAAILDGWQSIIAAGPPQPVKSAPESIGAAAGRLGSVADDAMLQELTLLNMYNYHYGYTYI
jgi:hypothetical protein